MSNLDLAHQHLDAVARLQRAIGRYRFYIYEGSAVANMSSALPLPRITRDYVNVPKVGSSQLKNVFPEYTAAVWIHRALLQDPSRTLNADEAELFFVPAYLAISALHPGHAERLAAWSADIRASPHYQRRGGADHLFATSDVRGDDQMRLHGHVVARELLGAGYTGAFESIDGWTGGWHPERRIIVPYVANPFVTSATRMADSMTRERRTSIFYYAHVRRAGERVSGCNRTAMTRLSEMRVPGFDLAQVYLGWSMLSQSAYAERIARAAFCPLTCGDTATSRRTFDAMAGGCVPILVGQRLWGRCVPPCRGNTSGAMSGSVQLPWHGLWLNWSVFPSVDESALDRQASEDGVQQLFRDAMASVTDRGRLFSLREYMQATRDELVYGWGDYRTSSAFGLVGRRLVESALLQLRGGSSSERAAPRSRCAGPVR